MLFDPIYWVVLGIAALLSGAASFLTRKQFARANRVQLRRHASGRDIAQAILREEGIDDVEVVLTEGFLSDHYNPISKTLALSKDVYHGTTAAAAGIAAHEVGHAIQHARGYAPLWLRSTLVPAANIGSMLGPWIVIAGIILGAGQGIVAGQYLAMVGIALFGAAVLFSLVTLPVEFDASARARERLDTLGLTSGAENDAVRGVLTAAGLTYVAAAMSSILMLLYWAFQAGLLGGREE
jgi:Zn-dependent membrane protease YugP